MNSDKDIVIVTDYHAKSTEFRWFDAATGEERTFNRPTERTEFESVLAEATTVAAGRGGQVVWIMESTTGWVRIKELIGPRAKFLLANVLQMPLPPKAYRSPCRVAKRNGDKKSDKLDTRRVLREYRNGELPCAFQPDRPWREARRVVALREDLVSRRTALRNRVTAYFAHETWEDRSFWSGVGMRRLKKLIASLAESDRFVLETRVEELESLEPRIERVVDRLMELYRRWPEARRLDSIDGIAEVSAVSILARIGPIDRFADDPEQLIAFAGLCPGLRQSDGTRRNLSIGGGGTDKSLRHYIIEATIWAQRIPRYRKAYQRVCAKRGKKVARIVVGRMLLRSIHKMLTDHVPFKAAA